MARGGSSAAHGGNTPLPGALGVMNRATITLLKAILKADADFLRAAVRLCLEEVLRAEAGGRSAPARRRRAQEGVATVRPVSYPLAMCRGIVVVRAPHCSERRVVHVFRRYARCEESVLETLAEMYLLGASPRKVKALTQRLCHRSLPLAARYALGDHLEAGLAGLAVRRMQRMAPGDAGGRSGSVLPFVSATALLRQSPGAAGARR